jgi:hypothetical protein
MNAAGKLTAFAVVLGGALGGGAALGAVVGPIDVDGNEPAVHGRHDTRNPGVDTPATSVEVDQADLPGHAGHGATSQEDR